MKWKNNMRLKPYLMLGFFLVILGIANVVLILSPWRVKTAQLQSDYQQLLAAKTRHHSPRQSLIRYRMNLTPQMSEQYFMERLNIYYSSVNWLESSQNESWIKVKMTGKDSAARLDAFLLRIMTGEQPIVIVSWVMQPAVTGEWNYTISLLVYTRFLFLKRLPAYPVHWFCDAVDKDEHIEQLPLESYRLRGFISQGSHRLSLIQAGRKPLYLHEGDSFAAENAKVIAISPHALKLELPNHTIQYLNMNV